MFMAVILLVTGLVTGLCFVTLRDQQINARLDELKTEAREIAFLAGQSSSSYMQSLIGIEDEWSRYLSYKATNVYNDFGAYILVVDRRGSVMDNMRAVYKEHPGFVASLNHRDMSAALVKVYASHLVPQAESPNQEFSVSNMIGSLPASQKVKLM